MLRHTCLKLCAALGVCLTLGGGAASDLPTRTQQMFITSPTTTQVDQAISDIVSDATAQQADLAACLGVSEETVAKLTALSIVVDMSTLRFRADGIAEIKGSARRDNQREIPVVLSFQFVDGKWTLLDGSLGALDSSIGTKATL